MNEKLPLNKPVKALGSCWPCDLIYTTNAKEALAYNRKYKGIRKLTLTYVMNQNGRTCHFPYSKKLLKTNIGYFPLA
jgi:hypothetical protein